MWIYRFVSLDFIADFKSDLIFGNKEGTVGLVPVGDEYGRREQFRRACPLQAFLAIMM